MNTSQADYSWLRPVLSLGEWVCLTLVAAGASHGWALVRELDRTGSLGAVWSLSRQLTYRAVEQLIQKDLLEPVGHEPGRGPGRILLGLTEAGQTAIGGWLDSPAVHIRDVRTETLLKLLLRDRLGLPNGDFLRAQQAALRNVIDSLLGPDHATAGFPDILRRETARATHRFLDAALAAVNGEANRPAVRPVAQLSARNQLSGTVTLVTNGDVMSTVRLTLPDGQMITAAITRDAADDLGFAPGDPITAIVKATEVLLAKN